ncbi:MAG: hypothetical protein KH295_03765 [Clostridiaceae bacterium]|nr:hypothetical protein [uncultured Agathobaculum sp.]MBS6640151.1 hypothetical protein [Clostridiaceae bacterium]
MAQAALANSPCIAGSHENESSSIHFLFNALSRERDCEAGARRARFLRTLPGFGGKRIFIAF